MKRLSLTALALLLLTSSLWAASPTLPRYPALSPDGSTLVFSFQGDLWSVPSEGGQALRLTAHQAYDEAPVFSADGSTIAFASDRFGDKDVFTMPASGGAPTRLTFASTSDLPQAFSPDGSTLYFASRRLFQYPNGNQIQLVPTSGGTPTRLADFFGDEAALYPGGERFVIAEGRIKNGRRRYRGTYQRDLYTYAPGGEPVQMTSHNGIDTQPSVTRDQRIWWISDDNETATQNVFVTPGGEAEKRQVTRFVDNHVRNYAVSDDGTVLVVEAGSSLYRVDPATGSAREIAIDVAADLISPPVEIVTKRSDASELTVSDDGEEFAMIVEGNIVLVNKELEGRARVIEDPEGVVSRELDLAFRPGSGDTLAFVSDRSGRRQIYLLVSADEEESTLRLAREHSWLQLTDGEQAGTSPIWSPDGSMIAYTHGNGDLYTMEDDGKSRRAVWKHWATPDYSWSPDGRWLAVAREDRNFNSDVWILPSDGSDEDAVNISQHPDGDSGPVWSANGQMLAWNSRRHGNQYDVYYVYLTRKLDERSREEWEIWEKTRDKKKDKGDDEDEDEDDEEKEKEEELVVEIDFDDIHLRSRRLTNGPAGEYIAAIDPKGDKFYYSGVVAGDRDLYSVNRFGEEPEGITSGGASPSAATLDAKGKTFYYLSKGKPMHTAASGGKTESVSFSARMAIDHEAMRQQVLLEGWQTLGDKFYHPQMHNVDWPAIKAKFLPLARAASHPLDFADVANWMLGELNSSHMGYYAKYDSPDPMGNDGWLGLEFDLSGEDQGLLIRRVLAGSPADQAEDGLEPGDILLSVDGEPVSASQNYYAALEGRRGLPTWVSFQRGRKSMELELRPTSYGRLRQLLYEEMEKENRSFTEQYSEDAVGYVHIQGMSMSEVERFEMNLYAAADDKDALVIDVRNNGGGWTTDMLMTILTQPVHAYTIARGGEVGYPQPRYPLYRWEKPVAVICNAGSYSNAEIFSHAIKSTGRGPLVGEETGGNVISTGGWTTLDGGWFRLPFRGWFVHDADNPERHNKNQEAIEIGAGNGTGAVPDYPVARTLADRMHDRDPQLAKAVELMIEAARDYRSIPQPKPTIDLSE